MRRLIAAALFLFAAPAAAEDAARAAMTIDRMDALIGAIGDEVERLEGHNVWRFSVEDVVLTVIADPSQDRMRVVSAIAPADAVPEDLMLRLMQANFDSALDARYAVARGNLWAAFIHPLSPLTDEQFISGVGQTANLVNSFGGSYSSGGVTFGGGDSQALILRGLIDRLLKRGEDI